MLQWWWDDDDDGDDDDDDDDDDADAAADDDDDYYYDNNNDDDDDDDDDCENSLIWCESTESTTLTGASFTASVAMVSCSFDDSSLEDASVPVHNANAAALLGTTAASLSPWIPGMSGFSDISVLVLVFVAIDQWGRWMQQP